MSTRTEVKDENSSKFPPTPLVQLRNVVAGTTFVGRKLKDVREAKNAYGGKNYFYEFSFTGGSAAFVLKGPAGYSPHKPATNEVVVLCATEPLHAKLKDLPVGTMVEIEYRGKKRSKKGLFHDYGVFTIED